MASSSFSKTEQRIGHWHKYFTR